MDWFYTVLSLLVRPMGFVHKISLMAASLAVLTVGLSSQPLLAESTDPRLLPENYDTPIAKELLKSLNDPALLRKTFVDFVNTAKAPLMCKLEVKPVYEQHMRQLANGGNPVVAKVFTKELVLRIQAVDEYCQK